MADHFLKDTCFFYPFRSSLGFLFKEQRILKDIQTYLYVVKHYNGDLHQSCLSSRLTEVISISSFVRNFITQSI
jgi:hypothetical protein